MTTLILSLPIPLILLVHLHILRYPHANEPEYDHKIFDPRVRGLRDRTKLMEDISYFLVGCLEGGRDGARSVREFTHLNWFWKSDEEFKTDLINVPMRSTCRNCRISNIPVKVSGSFKTQLCLSICKASEFIEYQAQGEGHCRTPSRMVVERCCRAEIAPRRMLRRQVRFHLFKSVID